MAVSQAAQRDCAVSVLETFQTPTGSTWSDPIDDPAARRRLGHGTPDVPSSPNDFMTLQYHKMLKDTLT